ncbi:MAG: NADP-dependent oxidoreductase [Cyanobacteria bacterium P01_F01_bin.33]
MQIIPQEMTAMAVDEFGGSEKLTLHSLPVPPVDTGEVLIRVDIAGVGIWDSMERKGELLYNEVHFPRVLGGECAGTIVAVGDRVERFDVGDRVYAQSFMNDKGGSYAQYVVVSEKTVAPVPKDFDLLMAGGLPIASATALSNLNALEISRETRLMLWGASGGVGHVALQLAKRMDASVFAIASGVDGVELAKQLGADAAVDGHRDNVVQHAHAFAPDGFDAALVLVGGDKVQSSLRLVRQGGIIAFPNGVVPEPEAPDGVALKKANGFASPMLLEQLNQLISTGEFQVHIAQTFPLEKAARAHDAMKQHYLGKIVLLVNGE